MTGTLYTADHRMFQLPPLLSWRVTHTGSVPCDSFSVSFVYQKEMAEVLRLAAGFAAEEGGTVMLRAVVDEYTVDLSITCPRSSATKPAAPRSIGAISLWKRKGTEKLSQGTVPVWVTSQLSSGGSSYTLWSAV